MELEQIDHVALTVTDMKRSLAWYQDLLGLTPLYGEVTGEEEPPIFLGAGSTAIAFFRVEGTPPFEICSGSSNKVAMQHLCFRCDRENFERAQAELRGAGSDLRFADHGNCHSVYLSDPDGHRIEISTYEL